MLFRRRLHLLFMTQFPREWVALAMLADQLDTFLRWLQQPFRHLLDMGLLLG